MRIVFKIALALALSVAALSAQTTVPLPLEPLTFLLGEWEAAGGGQPGAGTGGTTFARSLQDRVIVRTNYAIYPASATAPASRHDDSMMIYASEAGGVRADYYDSEGHVIRYAVSVTAPGHVSLVSDVVSGAPRYRLTYTLGPGGVLQGRFDVAPPGQPDAFTSYLAWDSRKVKPGD